jgi:NADH:ubiquinone oxidoreductase subunit 4 (subunit M)
MSPADTIAQPALWPLSLIVFLPALVAAVMALPVIPKAREELIRWITLATTIAVFVLSLWMAWPTLFGAVGPAQFTVGEAALIRDRDLIGIVIAVLILLGAFSTKQKN